MDSDFDDLGSFWRAESTDQDAAHFAALSARALRRARLIEGVEIAISAALMIFIIFGIWRKGTIGASLFGGLIVIMLLWSGWSRFRTRRVEWLADGASREAFLSTAITRMRARAQRTTWSLVLMIPATLLGTFFSATLSDHTSAAARLASGALAGLLLGAGLASVAGTLVFLWLRLRDQRLQLQRLTGIFDHYRREGADDESALRDD